MYQGSTWTLRYTVAKSEPSPEERPLSFSRTNYPGFRSCSYNGTCMLQIISGKFFSREERFRSEGKGVFFSNLSWFAPIETCVAKLEPTYSFGDITTYVVSYTNQIEKPEGPLQAGMIGRVGDAEILSQFEALCIFGLGAWFAGDRTNVELHCRSSPRGASDRILPGHFLPGFFTPARNARPGELEAFASLVQKTIDLPRETYSAVISALEGMRSSLEALGHNLDLAYSILVYCLESLSQQFDTYSPTWIDYDETIRKQIDKELADIDQDRAGRIRAILTKEKHLKLSKRFVDFVTSHIKPVFFVADAMNRERPLRQSELIQALKNAYKLRSSYVHNLEPLRKHLSVPQLASAEVIVWEHEPYLTYAGLFRLTQHVTRTFIYSQPVLKQETFAWYKDLPGTFQIEAAPQYWIHKSEALTGKNAVSYLSGVLSHMTDQLNQSTGRFTDLRSLVSHALKLMPQATLPQRRVLLAICYLWHTFITPAQRVVGTDQALTKYARDTDECSIELMAPFVLAGYGDSLSWTLKDLLAAFEKWDEKRFKPSALQLPLGLELAIVGTLANRAREQGDVDVSRALLQRALKDAAGIPAFQQALSCAIVANTPVTISVFLPHLKEASTHAQC